MPTTLDTPARAWHVLDDADLARLRASLMEDLARLDHEQRPVWVWRDQHATLLAVKRACGLRRAEALR